MDEFEALELAGAEFEKRVRSVGPEHWEATSPCEGWTVRDLVHHTVGGERLSLRLLAGDEAGDAVQAMVGDILGDDPVAAYVEASEALNAAFREPGALERTCHHPIGDIPGEMLRNFRITDRALHAWDLARAIGADEQLDEELVQGMYEGMVAVAPFVTATGMFGAGPSGNVPDDAPLQAKLLDLSGRRP